MWEAVKVSDLGILARYTLDRRMMRKPEACQILDEPALLAQTDCDQAVRLTQLTHQTAPS